MEGKQQDVKETATPGQVTPVAGFLCGKKIPKPFSVNPNFSVFLGLGFYHFFGDTLFYCGTPWQTRFRPGARALSLALPTSLPPTPHHTREAAGGEVCRARARTTPVQRTR
jgi:hypothetical protein